MGKINLELHRLFLHIYICIEIWIFCLFVCVNPITVIMTEPIGHKFSWHYLKNNFYKETNANFYGFWTIKKIRENLSFMYFNEKNNGFNNNNLNVGALKNG